MTDRLNLRHIRVFLAVMEMGGVTKASEFLFRAQSAVTRSVKELEVEFGVNLFERKASGMLPTAFGNALFFRAKRAAEEFKAAKGEMAALLRAANGALNAPIFSMLFNEHRLTTFILLVELHHMPTVALQLGISQPAVSATINELESSLRVPLFRRGAKGLLPTGAAEILAFRSKRALAELRLAKDDILALQGTLQGQVRVGALPLGRTIILPRAIAQVVAANPKLRIATIEGPFERLTEGLRSADIDFILGALRPEEYATDLRGEPLINERVSVVARAGHPLTRVRKIRLNDLLDCQWILSRPGTPARQLFDESFRKRGIEPPPDTVETSDLAVLRGLLLNSEMVTAISPQQLYYERRAGLLTVLDFEIGGASRWIGITHRTGSHPSPGAIVLMDAIRRVSAELQRDPLA
jgi:LysR family transcriptional regulator of gallate degradation